MADNEGMISNEDLSSVYRTEKASSQLTAIRKDFYVITQQYVEMLSNECERLLLTSPDSLMYDGAVQKKRKALDNLKKIVDLRMGKIANLALLGAKGANNVIDHLTSEEKEYYNKMLEDSKEFWRYSGRKKKIVVSQDITKVEEPKPVAAEPVPVTDDVPLSEIPIDDFPEDMGSPAEEIIEDEEIVQEPVPEPIPEPVPEPEPVQAPEMDDDEEVVIRILEDLPPFSGPDVDYDLRKEDIVRMPGMMAKALINRGVARIVPTA